MAWGFMGLFGKNRDQKWAEAIEYGRGYQDGCRQSKPVTFTVLAGPHEDTFKATVTNDGHLIEVVKLYSGPREIPRPEKSVLGPSEIIERAWKELSPYAGPEKYGTTQSFHDGLRAAKELNRFLKERFSTPTKDSTMAKPYYAVIEHDHIIETWNHTQSGRESAKTAAVERAKKNPGAVISLALVLGAAKQEHPPTVWTDYE